MSVRAIFTCLVLLAPLPGGAQSVEQRLGGDVFVGGAAVTVSEPVPGDLFAAGGGIDVDAPVAGDVVAAGGKLRLGADVGHTLYAAAGQLNVNGKVGRNARVMGGQVEFAPSSQVGGNLSVAGGQVRLRGSVSGQVQMAGGRLLIDSPVGGDVVATGGQLTLGPNARVAGKLRYRSGESLEQDPAAQVLGGVEKLVPFSRDGRDASPRGAAGGWDDGPVARQGWRAVVGVWTLGLMLLAALIVAALPRLSAGIAATLRERTGWSVAAGFAVLVCAPVAMVLLMITLVGIPIALAALALYFALLPVSYVLAAVAIGDWALARAQPARSAARGWRIAAACLAVLLLALVGWIPWLGGIVGFVALLAGLGALALQATPLRTRAAA